MLLFTRIDLIEEAFIFDDDGGGRRICGLSSSFPHSQSCRFRPFDKSWSRCTTGPYFLVLNCLAKKTQNLSSPNSQPRSVCIGIRNDEKFSKSSSYWSLAFPHNQMVTHPDIGNLFVRFDALSLQCNQYPVSQYVAAGDVCVVVHGSATAADSPATILSEGKLLKKDQQKKPSASTVVVGARDMTMLMMGTISESSIQARSHSKEKRYQYVNAIIWICCSQRVCVYAIWCKAIHVSQARFHLLHLQSRHPDIKKFSESHFPFRNQLNFLTFGHMQREQPSHDIWDRF